jgi:16S rRNA (cytosine967-C5)-methyltransferase
MSARDFALLELDAKRLPGWPADTLRHGNKKLQSTQPPADPRDRALAEQIIIGVVKNLLHLRWLSAHYAQRSLKSIDPLAQKILAIGLYQLRFLTRIPPSAAVDQAVEQSKRVGLGRASGFVNAVLRKSLREPAPQPPDRHHDPARYAELMLSHPTELFSRLQNLLGPDDALRFCEHDNLEPPLIVRLYNRASAEELTAPDGTILPHEQPRLFLVPGAKPALLADWARRGLAQVQDPTAANVVDHLDIQPGQRVLDRCCGLGTKTLQMQERVGPGSVLAVDPASTRLQMLAQLLHQRQIANVDLQEIGMLAQLPDPLRQPFDRILIDAPCGNSGVLARRPEARYAQHDSALTSLARLQDRILDDTAPWLVSGGRLVYSTCSVWPQENQMRIKAFLDRHPDYRLLEEPLTWPSLDPHPPRYHDGGYCATLLRA